MEYRVVFQGNQVHTANLENASFQGLGSSPASMGAGKSVDAIGSLLGNIVEQADADQAYLQFEFVGTETWAELLSEAWPDEWWTKDDQGNYVAV